MKDHERQLVRTKTMLGNPDMFNSSSNQDENALSRADNPRGTVYTVGSLTSRIKGMLGSTFADITVEGEISNFRPASSGHWYFQLNDKDASMQAVMFKQKTWRLGFIPKDGDKVTVTGSVDVYEKRGTYQIVCDSMKRSGVGDILALLEQRKQAFARAGYFDASRKRPIPRYPKRIGVVTSPTGAALQDILQVLQRRNGTIDVVVLPSPVQGNDAGPIIAARIADANRYQLADVLIVGRGGGSLEDLLPFSEQVVIEAIVNSTIPVISAVGHEIDWALSDFAADLRAPTPSAAAELASPDMQQMTAAVKILVQSMAEALRSRIELTRSRTRRFSPELMADYFTRRIDSLHLRLDDQRSQMEQAIIRSLETKQHSVGALKGRLDALSPLAVLDRGYAIVSMSDGKVVLAPEQVKPGDALSVRVAKGSFAAIAAAGDSAATDGTR